MANWKGMETDQAAATMQKMKSKKAELSNATATAFNNIKSDMNRAFVGQQVFAMQGYADKINEALQKFYKYIDGNESSFAQNLNEAIKSYEKSDENVAKGYNNSSVK